MDVQQRFKTPSVTCASPAAQLDTHVAEEVAGVPINHGVADSETHVLTLHVA